MVLSNKFLTTINNAYGKIHPVDFAKSMFKKVMAEGSIGDTFVSIISNTGIAGFRFHVPKTERVRMENEVTDHYVDTNSAVQDHIAKKPMTITSTGLVGEYFYSVNQVLDMIAKITPTLSLVSQFLPKISAMAQQVKGKRVTATRDGATQSLGGGHEFTPQIIEYRTVRNLNGVDLFNLFSELYSLKSKQTRAYLFFEAMREAAALFSVSTSWKRYDNMTLTTLEAVRNENADITEFSVSFKPIHFVESKVETIQEAAGRLKQQAAQTVKKGEDKGEKIELRTEAKIAGT